MRTRLLALAKLGFGIGVVGALVFGTAQMLAAAAREDPCQQCPYPSQTECDRCCQEELGFDGGQCFPSGACICY